MKTAIDTLKEILRAAGVASADKDADALLEKFGSLCYLMQCDSFKLEQYTGCSKAALNVIRIAAELTARRITDRFKVGKKYNDLQIKEYVVGLMLASTVESVYCILFDDDNRLLGAEFMGDGTVNAVGIMPRKMLECAFKHKAKKVIIAHNHPCGSPQPSDDDIRATMSLRSVAGNSGITLCSHYVVSCFDICDILAGAGGITADPDNEVLRVAVTPLNER